MATIASLTDDLQVRFADATGRFLDDVASEVYLNLANQEFCVETRAITREYGLVMVANQFLYTLPTDLIHVYNCMWMPDQSKVEYRPLNRLAEEGYLSLTSKGNPIFFCDDDKFTKMRLAPTTSAASASTTMNDAGGINTTDTSVILTSAASFRSQGIIKIEDELILYYAKSSNTLQQLVRGYGGTTAATHADATTVSQCDLTFHYSYFEGVLASTATPAIPSYYHRRLVPGALYHAYLSDGKLDKAQICQLEWQKILAGAKADFKERQSANFLGLESSYGLE